jgi:hypothetical protein
MISAAEPDGNNPGVPSPAQRPDRESAGAGQLAWRKGPAVTPMVQAAPRPELEQAIAVAASPSRNSPAANGSAPATPSVPAGARTPPPAPDNAQVDRLAGQVIERIERRMRIERERRGL